MPQLTDAESVQAFKAEHQQQIEIEEYINSHPYIKSLRSNPNLTEARPHLKFSDTVRATSLTAGVLTGPGKVVVPPIVFYEDGGKSLIMVAYLGEFICGFPGFIHGGLLATLLDEALGTCTFPALPNKLGMTASLTLNYRAPTKAGQYIVVKAKVTKSEGRKAWAEGHIETLPKKEEEEPVKLVEATGLFVEPKQMKVYRYLIY